MKFALQSLGAALTRKAFEVYGLRACWVILVSLHLTSGLCQSVDQDRLNLMVEVLSRLEPAQVKSNPKLENVLAQVLKATRGTSRFVELVRRFQIKDQNPALLELVFKNPKDAFGVEALRLLLDFQGLELVRNALSGTNVAAAACLTDALGNVGGNQIVPLLEPLVNDPKRDLSLRKGAVRALTRTQEGAGFLLKLAREDKLAADLKLVAAIELNQVQWPAIRKESARILPPPQSRSAEPLPPISALVKMKGDAARGAEVFTRPNVACINCHQVNGKGIDFGPRLSEIGAKLGPEGLYEAILDPSAGISFDYEAWQVQFKNGDDAYGLIVSETADELALKTQNGIVSHYQKNEIASRQKMTTSTMPAGLQQAMSVQDLVDLVEYLTSLRKASD
ncbi:MAG: c-type cytochrome [Verrucomicrobia bacterium]|nr:c-type cytochrome [Verrucomicrobiota bacterium]